VIIKSHHFSNEENMAKHSKKTFSKQTVVLDGNEFDQCTFDGCVLEFQGLRPVALNTNTITNCQWSFKGPAANAVQFMSALYQSGASGAQLIEATFNGIRGLVPQPTGPQGVPSSASVN
jgi:hypothetical protein